MPSLSRRLSPARRLTNLAFQVLAAWASMLVLAPLAAILGYLLYKGVGALSWSFLTQTPRPIGEPGGGMANAIVGSMMILGLGSLIGVPLGIGAGIYMAEFEFFRPARPKSRIFDFLILMLSLVVARVVFWAVSLLAALFTAFFAESPLLGFATGIVVALAAALAAGGFVLERLGFNPEPLVVLVRFVADVLAGVPSIVIGIAVYALVVIPQQHFSALSGGIALGVMMIPTVARTTEEMLRMVPQTIREAALALGISRWRTTLQVVLPTASKGVVTGVMLAFARVAGETAPLLFTAFGNQFWNLNPSQPTAALPLQIFAYAISPFDEWHRQAWAGALILIILIVVAVAAVRIVTSRGNVPHTQ